jgi:hypoxanthine phosphoribosyltransferase
MKKSWNFGINKILISEADLSKRIKELGAQITNDYKNSEKPLIIVCLLKGSILFMSDLCREIKLPLKMDFLSVSSYGDGFSSSGEVKILKELDETIMGKDVLIVEDIIDTGRTLDKIISILSIREPNSLKIVSLLDKPSRREVEMEGDYIGFIIPNEFVIGYGLDYKQEYRNIPYIGVMGSDI